GVTQAPRRLALDVGIAQTLRTLALDIGVTQAPRRLALDVGIAQTLRTLALDIDVAQAPRRLALDVGIPQTLRTLTLNRRVVHRDGVLRKRRGVDDVKLLASAEDDGTGAELPRAQVLDLGRDVVFRRAAGDGEGPPIDQNAVVVGKGTSGVLRLRERQRRDARRQRHERDRQGRGSAL